MKGKLQISAMIGSCVVIVAASSVWAQSPSPASTTPTAGITVTPPTFELSGNVGDTLNHAVRVDNLNAYPITLAVDKRNFTAIGEEGAVGLTEEETSFSLANWLAVLPTQITIPGKGSQTFNYSITIPQNAEPGGHFGSLVFRTISTEAIGGSGASLAQEIGSLILLKIAGDSYEEGDIVSFNPVKQLFEYGPVILETRLENKGNVHLKPTGTITITDLLGRQVASLPLESRNILPGSTRRIDTTWNTKWGIGRYTATVVVVYGRDATQRAAVTNFFLFPYKLIILIFVLLAIICMALYRSRRRWMLALRILFTGKS